MAKTILNAASAGGAQLEKLQERASEAAGAVSDGAARLADAARRLSRSMADSLAQFAANEADAAKQAMTGAAPTAQGALKATTLAVVSTAALQTAGRTAVRFAARRPLLFLVGGVALVGWALSARKKAREGGDETLSEDIREGGHADASARLLKEEGSDIARRAAHARRAPPSSARSTLKAAGVQR